MFENKAKSQPQKATATAPYHAQNTEAQNVESELTANRPSKEIFTEINEINYRAEEGK